MPRTRKRWSNEDQEKLESFCRDLGPEPFHRQVSRQYRAKHDQERSLETIHSHVINTRRRLWPGRFETLNDRELRIAEENFRAAVRDPMAAVVAATTGTIEALRELSHEQRERVVEAVSILYGLHGYRREDDEE